MRQTLTNLLVIALCLRFMLPAGFMPVAGADSGIFTVVICTGSGPVTQVVGEDGKPQQAPSQGDYGACSFAAASAAPIPSIKDRLAAPPPLTETELLRTSLLEHGFISRHELPTPARGPPALIS